MRYRDVLFKLPNLVELNVAELENVPWGFLDKTPKLEVLNAPLLNNRLKVLRRHPNKRKLLRKMQISLFEILCLRS